MLEFIAYQGYLALSVLARVPRLPDLVVIYQIILVYVHQVIRFAPGHVTLGHIYLLAFGLSPLGFGALCLLLGVDDPVGSDQDMLPLVSMLHVLLVRHVLLLLHQELLLV